MSGQGTTPAGRPISLVKVALISVQLVIVPVGLSAPVASSPLLALTRLDFNEL